MANRIDRQTLINQYIKLRALDWSYVKNRRENISTQMERTVALCALEGISQQELETAWEEWKANYSERY